ncbi:S8 family serine peptidase [Streptomyces sp. NPDC056708]|uniref:S8 family serine peptidase n=1 Tax=unclassified Streptomyces TaxID=2593676 RepID=UPI003695E34B
MRRSLIAALALLPLAATMAPAAATDAGTGDRTVTRIVTVSGDSAADRAAVLDEAERAGIDLTVTRRFDTVLSGFTVRVLESDAARLAALPDVAEVAAPVTYEAPPSPTPVSAETVRRAVADAAPGDGPGARESSPSGREIVTVTGLTGVAEAHRAGHTGKGVTVGIIDSGIAYDHPALGGGGFPNAKVTGGWDFADEDADPYDSSTGPATGHGTHVAGIIAGDGPQTVGVAPDATLRAYRVFGEKNQPTDELVIAALEKAVEDGVDIVNLSLGNPNGARSSNALARAVDRVSHAGVTATVAIGNGYAGPFRAASPAVADEAIAVGSTHSERYGYLAFRFADGTDTPIPYLNITRAPSTPADGSLSVVKGTPTCDALPEGSLTGKAVLFTGTLGLPCKPMDAIRRFEAAGAEATVYYTTSGDQLPGAIFCCEQSGIPGVVISETAAKRILAAPSGTALTWGAYAGISYGPDQAGLMDASSSWGPGNEQEFKPDLAAPGGSILSTLPRHLGWYGVESGTSMAAPHVAGIVALMLAEHPGLKPGEVRGILQNTADPVAFTGDHTRGAQPVAQQGAGRVNALGALAAADRTAATATPSELPLGDTEGRESVRRITVHNPAGHPVTYTAGHTAAISAQPPYTSEWVAADAGARADFSAHGRITVPAHGSRSFTVRLREPHGVPQGTLYGGWIELTPAGADTPEVRVPYQGVAGDLDAVSAVNPTFTRINTTLDNPALRPGYFSFGKSLPVTVDLSNESTADDSAWLMLSHDFPLLERMRVQAVDAHGKVVATPYDVSWLTRNSGAGTGVDFYGWDAKLADGSPAPAGTYTLRFVFDKAGGDKDHAAPREIWNSPAVTVVR